MKRTFAALLTLATISVSPAATIFEYFNGYGTSDSDLAGQGSAGGGWAGAWFDSHGGPAENPGSLLGQQAAERTVLRLGPCNHDPSAAKR